MKRAALFCVAVLVIGPFSVRAQVPQPGPEMDELKALVGKWEATVKAGPQESKGIMTYKLDLGGLWLLSEFEGDFEGQKFTGRGFDSYDPVRKKYVSIWVDSMSTSPVVSEGTYDKKTKTMTMTGEGPGMDGKLTKMKMVTEQKDKDTMHWTLFGPGPDGKEAEMMSITYKRKK